VAEAGALVRKARQIARALRLNHARHARPVTGSEAAWGQLDVVLSALTSRCNSAPTRRANPARKPTLPAEGAPLDLHEPHRGQALSAFHRTVRALSESEERYRHLAHCSIDMISRHTPDSRVVFVSPACQALLGYTPAELLGKRGDQFVHPADRTPLWETIRTQTARSDDYSSQHRMRHKAGHYIWIETRGRLVKDPSSGTLREIVCFTRDVGERRRLEEQLQSYAAQMRSLSHQLVTAQENERRHIARELHDETGQALTAIQITLQSAIRLPAPAAIRARLQDGLRLVDGALDQVQALSLSLRPAILDDLGLEAALRSYPHAQIRRAGIRYDFAAPRRLPRLDAIIETACFRVAQEALTNVVRHARARHVRVELRRLARWLKLEVVDDGVGFDVRRARAKAAQGASLGLLSMTERVRLAGGRIQFRQGIGGGTAVHAWFPFRQRAAPAAPGAREP
jgi:PAS domain S-box-containing protein